MNSKLALVAALLLFVGPAQPEPAKVEAPKSKQTRLDKLTATRVELSKLNNTPHEDGSIYVDVLTAPVSPGKVATESVTLPDGAALVPDSATFIGVASGKFQLLRLEMHGKMAVMTATNTSTEVVPMAAVFRYRP